MNPTQSIEIRAGQVWRSLRLHDYSVRLLQPINSRVYDDVWAIEPMGSSAHGSYTIRESMLRNVDTWRLEDASCHP